MKSNESSHSNENLIIFYADDDEDDLETFTDAIQQLHNKPKLVTLNGGFQLLDALNNPPPTPSIVFVDLNMPGKNGYEVIREIRANKNLSHLPVVVLSTSSDELSIAMSNKVGANYYVIKASSFQELTESIKYVINIDWNTFKPNLSDFVYRYN